MSLADTKVLTKRSLGGLEVQPVTEALKYINMLVYGNSGVGKSVLAGSASEVPQMSPVLVIDMEGGTMSLTKRYPKVEVVRPTSLKHFEDVYEELRRGKHNYRTVILDSLTEIRWFSMDQIMEEAVATRANVDPDVPAQRDWGKNISQIRKIVRYFRDLPMNTIYTALAADNKDPKTGFSRMTPSLPGKLASEVAGFMDIVVYMYVKAIDGEIKRYLLTQATDKEVAKDRSDDLPKPVLEEPTMQKIYNYAVPNKETM